MDESNSTVPDLEGVEAVNLGAVSEWFKEMLLKSIGSRGPEGSNPSCSVSIIGLQI